MQINVDIIDAISNRMFLHWMMISPQTMHSAPEVIDTVSISCTYICTVDQHTYVHKYARLPRLARTPQRCQTKRHDHASNNGHWLAMHGHTLSWMTMCCPCNKHPLTNIQTTEWSSHYQSQYSCLLTVKESLAQFHHPLPTHNHTLPSESLIYFQSDFKCLHRNLVVREHSGSW